MELNLPALRREEVIALKLRALFEEKGYRLFRTGSFEEYDLYMQNRPFLMEDDIITFTGADGRLMALKPDVTLSIVKSTPAGVERRVYYDENVYRRSKQSGDYREISQMGLEYIGNQGLHAEEEVLSLAVKSLAVIGDSTLDLSHIEFIEAILSSFPEGEAREKALWALQSKSPHEMAAAAGAAGLSGTVLERLSILCQLSGPFEKALADARRLSLGVAGARRPLDELDSLYNAMPPEVKPRIRLDFSLRADTNYYNGLVFQGFVKSSPRPVLAGGRYDHLLSRFGKPQGAVGFGLYLDALFEEDISAAAPREASPDYLNIALPKGRLGEDVYALFEKAGLSCRGLFENGRKLIYEDEANGVRYFLVKPSDVHIYVEHGVADIGVVGKDILLENNADVLELMDLNLGKCFLAVAGRAGFEEDHTRPLRVAAKYESIARHYFAGKSRSVEVIRLSGSIELAPLIGLADVIVDIVESGSTLKENNLLVLEEIVRSSARLIANRASYRFNSEKIETLLGNLRTIV